MRRKKARGDKVSSIYWHIYNFLLGLAEVGIFYVYVTTLYPKKKNNTYYNLLVILGMAILIYGKTQLHLLPIWNALVVCIIVLLEAWLLVQVEGIKYFASVAVYYALVALVDLCVGSIINIFAPVSMINLLKHANWASIMISILSKLMLFLVVKGILVKEEDKGEFFKRSLYLLLGIFVLSVIAIYNIAELTQVFNGVGDRVARHNLCILALMLLFINVISHHIIMQLNSKLNAEKVYEVMAYQNMILSKAVMDNKEVEAEWRKNKHDFNNHLGCVDMLLQMNNVTRARSYIQNLTQHYLEQSGQIKLGNEIIDAVINQKVVLAHKQAINIEVTGSIEQALPMSEMDLCALIGNGLDNAIEAAVQIEEAANRQIWVNIKIFGEHLIIDIENTVKEDLQKLQVLKTTKKDKKLHGIGMKSMQQVVDKYHGHMEWKCENQCFSLLILLPMMDAMHSSLNK